MKKPSRYAPVIKGGLVLLLLAAVTSLAAGEAGAQQRASRGRIVVLGFTSPSINDVQDRILRETLMRKFKSRGYGIIPVMDLERYILDTNFSLRNVTRSSLKSVCGELSSDYSLTGSIEVRRRHLFASIALYQRRDDQYFSFIIPMGRSSDFQRFCNGLARDIVDKADVLLMGGRK